MLPYESQPSNNILQNAKEFDSKILLKVTYFCSTSFPTEYIFRRYSPDRLYHGSGQKEILNKFFSQQNEAIKSKVQKISKEKENFIYLPYNINNPKDLLKNFENFKNQKDYSFKKTFIKPHPLKKRI